jgi:Flp pilus assembly protein TadG
MIEFALVLPLLLLLVLGTIELGMIFSRYQILLASAREGARVASLYRINCNARRVKGEVDQAVMNSGSQLGMLLLPSNVTVQGACVANGNVTVRLRYRHYFTALGGLLSTNATLPLNVTVVMRNF